MSGSLLCGSPRLLASRAYQRTSRRSHPYSCGGCNGNPSASQMRGIHSQAWFRQFSSTVATRRAQSQTVPADSYNRTFEVVLASSLAFCATGALVLAVPSNGSESMVQNPSFMYGGGGGGGGGSPMDSKFSSVIFVDTDGSLSTGGAKKSSPPLSLQQRENVTSKETPYDVSIRALKGGRLNMEDEYVVAEGGRFCGVFDGHGGGSVSQYLRSKWYPKVCAKLNQTTEELADPSNVSSSTAALRATFEELEAEIVANDAWQYQGSTAVTVMVHEFQGKRTLLSANVGDSRAILSRSGNAIDLTRDHKPNDEREKTRILSMGETLEWDNVSKVHRVRSLSLSRALGDSYAKPVVSAQVEIQRFPVQEDTDEFMLLASDGLWDVMTSQDVVTYVHRRMERDLAHMPSSSPEERANAERVMRRNMSKWVAREALRRGTADNVCVVMVWLNDKDKIQER